MTQVPTISPLPEAPDRANDSPTEFSNKADAFVDALSPFRSEASALGQFSEDVAAAVSGIGLAAYQTISLADTADSDPGSGKLKFGNTTQRDATALYLDDNDINGTSIRAQIAKFDDSDSAVKGDLSLRDRTDQSKWLIYEVTGITQKTGYTVVTVQNGDGASTSPMADTDDVVIGFTRAGNKGEQGADGNVLGASKGFVVAMSLIF